MFQFCDLAVEPEMYPGERRMTETRQQPLQPSARWTLRQRRKQLLHSFKRQRQHDRLEVVGPVSDTKPPPPCCLVAAQLLYPASKVNSATGTFYGRCDMTVHLAQRHAWYSHATRFRREQKCFTKDLRRITHGDAVRVFVQGAEQDGLPEVLYRPRRLPCVAQPIRKVLPVILRAATPEERCDGTCDRDLVAHTERLGHQKRRRAVQRSGKLRGLQLRPPPTGFQKGDALGPAHCIFRTRTPQQIQNVSAAAEDNVLTVVDDFTNAGMEIG